MKSFHARQTRPAPVRAGHKPPSPLTTDITPSAQRADQLLVIRGLAPSRSAAQRLISTGQVWRACGHGDERTWHPVSKPAEKLPCDVLLQINSPADTPDH